MKIKKLTPKQAAEYFSVNVHILRIWDKAGKIRTERTPGGDRRYIIEISEEYHICYCRVSSHRQKDELERQIKFMQGKYPDVEIIRDIGSGPNFRRKGLRTILEQAFGGDWTDVSRWFFNWTMDFIRSCVGFIPNWMEIKKYATRFLPGWTRQVPFQIKGIAIREACEAFWKAKGKPSFRTRKNPEQSCFIPKSALKNSGFTKFCRKHLWTAGLFGEMGSGGSAYLVKR